MPYNSVEAICRIGEIPKTHLVCRLRYSSMKNILLTIVLSLSISSFIACHGDDASRENTLRLDAKEIRATRPDGRAYTGSESCNECHQEIYRSFVKTAHSRSSSIATDETVSRQFSVGNTTLELENDSSQKLLLRMEERSNGYFQSLVRATEDQEIIEESRRADIVIGSGRKGISYLYWKRKFLFQLPAMYHLATESWRLGPGFRDANFQRKIIPRCLECHSTYFQRLKSKEGNKYSRVGFVAGIGCESCHSPGAKHVAFHRANPNVSKGRFIVNSENLPYERQLNVCQACHASNVDSAENPFSFVPGDNLDDHMKTIVSQNSSPNDVHGNQFVHMAQSKCFKVSGNLTCSSCHDSHRTERSDMAKFSERCLNCHMDVSSCGMAGKLGEKIASNCIDCHMPNTPSLSITVELEKDKFVPVEVRKHRIGIYPDKGSNS